MVERLRAFLQEIGLEGALAGVAAFLTLLLLALSVAVIWFGVLHYRQVAEAEAAREESTVPQEETWPEESPLAFGPEPSPEPAEVTSVGGRPRGIPGLLEMDVIGQLRYVPGTDFRCPGGSPDRGHAKRTCGSPSSEEDPAYYEVTFVEEAGAVVSVVATARDAPEEEAAGVLGQVAKLAVEGRGPADPEGWVDRNISSGGRYTADGAELRLYGTEASRTLEIVATGPPASRVPETTPPSSARQPTTIVPSPK